MRSSRIIFCLPCRFLPLTRDSPLLPSSSLLPWSFLPRNLLSPVHFAPGQGLVTCKSPCTPGRRYPLQTPPIAPNFLLMDAHPPGLAFQHQHQLSFLASFTYPSGLPRGVPHCSQDLEPTPWSLYLCSVWPYLQQVSTWVNLNHPLRSRAKWPLLRDPSPLPQTSRIIPFSSVPALLCTNSSLMLIVLFCN